MDKIPIDNIELAKKVDLVLDIVINEYLKENGRQDAPLSNHLYGFLTEEKKKQSSKYDLTLINSEIEARAVYRTMQYLNILWSEPPNLMVTDYGFYLYENGGVAIRVKQEIEDRVSALQVNESVITTNKNLRYSLWLTFMVAALGCYFQFDNKSKNDLRDENTRLKDSISQLNYEVPKMGYSKTPIQMGDTTHVEIYKNK
jgi:hypothetical protein